MPATIAPPEVNTKPKGSHNSSGGGFDAGGWRGDDSNRWGDFGGSEPQTPIDAYRLAMWLALASIVMLFAGLSSAYVFRMGASPDWRSISIPAFLLPNSCLLLASSLTLELFRRGLKNGLDSKTRLWVALTSSLGAGFLVGQVWIWKALSAQGIYLSSNPHSSFFYLMTGTHGVHLAGGVIALLVLGWKTWRHVHVTWGLKTFSDLTAIYWHFMDGLWIYLFLLLFLWR
jgi:cytochrome c oxidase subunit III